MMAAAVIRRSLLWYLWQAPASPAVAAGSPAGTGAAAAEVLKGPNPDSVSREIMQHAEPWFNLLATENG